jgi:hypothetical protein
MNKRKITYRVLIDGVVTKSNTEMRRVYTDSQGEYIKSMGRKYRLVNDSYDLNYYTVPAISLNELFGVEL